MSSLIPSVSLRPRRAEADKINQHGVRGMFVLVADNGVVISGGYAAACANLRETNRHIANPCYYRRK
jgi:hypothetical protein